MKFENPKKYIVIFVSLFMISSGFGFLFSIPAVTGSGGDDHNPYAGSSPRTVCVETFTADWCVFCPGAAHVFERLMDELGHDDFFLIEHHSSASDELYLASSGSSARMAKYGVGGYPVGLMDGGGPYTTEQLWTSGSAGKYTTYMTYRPMVETELARTSPCLIEIDTEIWATGGNAHVTIDFTDIPSEDNLQLQVMVQEGSLFHRDGNTNEANAHHRVYNNVVRDILAPVDLPWPITPGDHYEYDVPFTLDSGWYPSMDLRRIGVSALVQTTNMYNSGGGGFNYPILQAAYHECLEPEVLVVNADDTDNLDNDIDHFDEELTKVNINKHVMWDTFEATDSNADNVRTNPTFADMAPYKAVIWYQGTDSSTLSAFDRTNIGQYLDGGGSMFLTGSYVAQDANSGGWDSWLQTYFYSSLTSGDTGGTTMNGVASDPIGDGLSNIAIEATSPDGLSPFGGTAYTSFTYNTGPNAVVRATHSSGSRTVLFGCNYFLNTDTIDGDVNDETIMLRIFGPWLDAAQPPDVTLIEPNGGMIYNKFEAVDIAWDAEDVSLIELPVSIYFCDDYPIATWQLISSGESNDGFYGFWTTPDVDSDLCRIRVVAEDSQGQNGEDVSDTDFTIGNPNDPPTITLSDPNGGQLWMGGTSQAITWTMSDPQDPESALEVDIYYSNSGPGGPWIPITSGLIGATFYSWNPIPSIDSANCYVRVNVTDTGGMSDQDDGDGAFEIDSTAPMPTTNANAELTAPNHVTISWDASPSGDVDHYEIYYRINNWDSNGDGYSYLASTSGLTYQHNNVGILNPSTYYYQIRTVDVVGYTTRSIIQAGKTGSTQSTFANPSGWFMLGSHLRQSDTSLAHVIQGAGLPANWDCVEAYDAMNDEWISNIIGAPGSINDLNDITNEMGFWLHVSSSTRFATAGYVEDLSIDLYAGWNLVPYPFAEKSMTSGAIMTQLATDLGADYAGMEIADYTAPYRMKTPDGTETLAHGSGFWVLVNADTTWTVLNY